MRVALCLLSLILVPISAFGQGNQSPTRLYDAVAESTYLLHQCGALTAERKEWLRHLVAQARKRTDWTDAQWAEHDVAITADLRRTFPGPPSKERCAELARLADVERKTLIRD